MTEQELERLLEEAAQSSEMPGWNDRLYWLVEATLAGSRTGEEIADEDLDYVAAGKALPGPKAPNAQQPPRLN